MAKLFTNSDEDAYTEDRLSSAHIKQGDDMSDAGSMQKLPLRLVRLLRAKTLAWTWRIGLIDRTTAFRWEVDVAVWPMAQRDAAMLKAAPK